MSPEAISVVSIIALVLGAVAAALHIVAPKTKTTADDKLASFLDALVPVISKAFAPADPLPVSSLSDALHRMAYRPHYEPCPPFEYRPCQGCGGSGMAPPAPPAPVPPADPTKPA